MGAARVLCHSSSRTCPDAPSGFPSLFRLSAKEGKIQYREGVTEGLEQAPAALVGLLRGEAFGKRVIHVAG